MAVDYYIKQTAPLPRIPGLALILFFALIFSPSTSIADILVTVGDREILQGSPVTLEIRVEGFKPVAGEIFHRPGGRGVYLRQPFNVATVGNTLQVQFPGAAVVSPSVEYYVVLEDSNGNKYTSPASYPEENPYRLEVAPALSGKKAAEIRYPAADSPVTGDSLAIQISYNPDMVPHPDELAVMLDDTEISDFIVFSRGQIEIPLPFMPEEGEHLLSFYYRDKDGSEQEISRRFMVSRLRGSDKELFARGGTSFNYSQQVKHSDGKSSADISGNLGLNAGIRGHDWETSLNGTHVTYVKDRPGDDLTIGSGFKMLARKDHQLLEFGDVTINETSLTAPSLARRGILARLKGFDTDLHVFNVSAESVTGWESGMDDSDNNIYGASISRSFTSGKNLRLSGVYLEGKKNGLPGLNSSGNFTPSAGETVGFHIDYKLKHLRAAIEFADSRYDADTSDNQGPNNDNAGSVTISTRLKETDIEGGGFHYGSDFASIANPFFTADREGFFGKVMKRFNASSIGIQGAVENDNVDKNPSRPIVTSSSSRINFQTSFVGWPSINTFYSRTKQDSSNEPAGSSEVDNINDAVGLSLSKGGRNWSAGASGQFSTIDDRIGTLDSKSRSLNIYGDYSFFDGASLSPAASYSENESGSVTTRTRLLSLSTSLTMGPKLSFNIQGSYLENDASDGSSDSSTLNGSCRLASGLENFLPERFRSTNATLAVTANYNHTRDRITPSSSNEDLSIFLSLNLFAPFNLTSTFQTGERE